VWIVSLAPQITVVIPCRDDADFLAECLAALEAQTHPADRVIVVDNGSTDDSAAVARRFGAEVFEEQRVGIWPAAARGYDEAMRSGMIIARLDADSRPHSDWIARLVRAFVAEPDLGVLTGSAEFYGSTPLVHYLGEHWYIGGGHYWIQKWLGRPLVFGSNFAMRSAVWERVRDRVDRDNADIHDDLDLTIQLRPTDGIRYDATLRMPVSSRPLVSQRGLWRRVGRVVTTFAASWPDGAPWRRRGERWERTDAATAPIAPVAPRPDEWSTGDEDWAPGYGR
jgi:glycosyltransferase involved in cell wall biosynthesis